MNNEEIKTMRDVFAAFGFELTPEEVSKPDYIDKLEYIKSGFQRFQPHVEEFQNKINFGILDIQEMAAELTYRFGTEITEDQCKHFLLMNKVFQYEIAS